VVSSIRARQRPASVLRAIGTESRVGENFGCMDLPRELFEEMDCFQ